MNSAAERGVSVQEGPVGRRHIASTVVGREGGRRVWISTVEIPNLGFSGTKPAFETATFDITRGVDLRSERDGTISIETAGRLKLADHSRLRLHSEIRRRSPDTAARTHSRRVGRVISTLSK